MGQGVTPVVPQGATQIFIYRIHRHLELVKVVECVVRWDVTRETMRRSCLGKDTKVRVHSHHLTSHHPISHSNCLWETRCGARGRATGPRKGVITAHRPVALRRNRHASVHGRSGR